MVSRRRAAGFTLPELMVVVIVVAVLGGLAAPSFSQMIAAQRVKGAAGELFAALIRTRSEAIKRNTEVTLAPTTSGRWQDGWVIPNPADSGNRIEVHGALPNIVLTGPASVVYLANGRLKNSTAPSIQVSAAGTTQVRCIGIDLSGRPFQKSSAC